VPMEKDWFKIALTHFDAGNYSQALLAVSRYINENPESQTGKLLKAVLCRELCNFNLSLSLLKEIAPEESDDVGYKRSYFREMAETLEAMGNFNEAVIWFDKLIELIPGSTSGYILKGACLAAAGHYELAKTAHLKATFQTGHTEEAYYNLALISRAEMNFEEAKKYCERSLEIDPNDTSVRHCYDDIIEALKLQAE